jgi:preprotein translocase subunit YajC
MEQLSQFIPLILIGGLMYVVLILPQQRRGKEHRTLLASLEEGDEVVMSSGIHGFVSAIDGDILWVEVADKVELKVSKSSVAGKITPPDEPEDDAAAEDS